MDRHGAIAGRPQGASPMNTPMRPLRRDIIVAISTLIVVVLGSSVEATSPPARSLFSMGQGEDIDWRTSPLDLNLRGLNGERFRFRCPPGKPAAGQVLGSGPYTDGSSICAAAVHAGVLRASKGGTVIIEVRPGQSHYAGSLSHYIQSEAYEPFWSGSFLIIANAISSPSRAAPKDSGEHPHP